MQATQFIWKNDRMIDWDHAHTHILTHALHYGSAVFEGIRVYQTDRGPAVFKLKQHIARFFYSAQQLGMHIPYSEDDICQAVLATLAQNGLEEGYIRPLAYYGYGSMKVVPEQNLPVDVMIACWPWRQYLPVPAIDVAISSYIRIHPQSTVADAKISGHYVNSILAGLAIRNTHYHEALLLDAEGYVAEGSAENIFIVKNGTLTTTPAGTILVGITRNTILEIAHEFGIPVAERRFKPEEIYRADEAFCCGTAVEVTAIRSVNDHIIAHETNNAITEKIKHRYQQIIRGQAAQYDNALTRVPVIQEAVA